MMKYREVHGPLQTLLSPKQAKERGRSNTKEVRAKNIRGRVPKIGGRPTPFVALAKSLYLE